MFVLFAKFKLAFIWAQFRLVFIFSSGCELTFLESRTFLVQFCQVKSDFISFIVSPYKVVRVRNFLALERGRVVVNFNYDLHLVFSIVKIAKY